ncbi:MAG TPA: 2'-5' RNA ligase family protein [Chitinophagaceae bacterium]|nr:2'-5' RNA ligase family protein [Chitinophagaceae bacterium]
MAEMYFIALVAPNEIDQELAKWKLFMKERYDCVVALRSPAHITLIPPFWMKDTSEDELENVMREFSQQQNPFELGLKNFAAFPPRAIYVDIVPNAPLMILHTLLEEYLTSSHLFPIKKDVRPFHPHITIASRDIQKKDFPEVWNTFKEKKYEAAWPVDTLALLRYGQKKWDVIFTSQFKNQFTSY